jgi:hypothetical protein
MGIFAINMKSMTILIVSLHPQGVDGKGHMLNLVLMAISLRDNRLPQPSLLLFMRVQSKLPLHLGTVYTTHQRR